jgi:hypothetical protein
MMSREEDLIRSTTHAIASTVREVPPLRLEPAPGAPRARAWRRPPASGRPRRWWSWGAPLAAAAVVVALAVSLVIVRDMPNERAVSRNPAASAGVPRYYVALKQLAGDRNSPTQRNDIVVGDSLTGKTLATLAPPARTAFESVTAAADDRTFVVFGVTSSTGSFLPFSKTPGKKPVLTGSWYAVRLTPGAARPARLTRLPIKPLSVPSSAGAVGLPPFIDSFGSVLSGSGQQLAVPVWDFARGLAVRVFSVATGQLLHEWTTNDSSVRQQPSLAWIDGDRKLALLSRSESVKPNAKFVTDDATVREWPVAGPATGDLVAASRVVWSVQTNYRSPPFTPTAVQQCVEPVAGLPVLFSADGKTFSCTTAGGRGQVDHMSFHTYPLAASTTATTRGTIDYDVSYTGKGRYSPEVLWTSASGGTLIGALFPVDGSSPAPYGPRIGVISQGKFTPLRLAASLRAGSAGAGAPVIAIAF